VGVEVFLLGPTESGDDAGERFCVTLPSLLFVFVVRPENT
jgi:hypothetical protein